MTSTGLISQSLQTGHRPQAECQCISAGSQQCLASISSACPGSISSSPHFCTAWAKTRNILRSISPVMRDRDFTSDARSPASDCRTISVYECTTLVVGLGTAAVVPRRASGLEPPLWRNVGSWGEAEEAHEQTQLDSVENDP